MATNFTGKLLLVEVGKSYTVEGKCSSNYYFYRNSGWTRPFLCFGGANRFVFTSLPGGTQQVVRLLAGAARGASLQEAPYRGASF